MNPIINNINMNSFQEEENNYIPNSSKNEEMVSINIINSILKYFFPLFFYLIEDKHRQSCSKRN